MRREAAFLDDILHSASAIVEICRNLQLAELMVDEVAQAAVLHHFTVIGEAASRIPAELRSRHPEIPWSPMISQRNWVVHESFGVDWVLLWKTVVEDVPRLRDHVAKILRTEYDEEKPAGDLVRDGPPSHFELVPSRSTAPRHTEQVVMTSSNELNSLVRQTYHSLRDCLQGG